MASCQFGQPELAPLGGNTIDCAAHHSIRKAATRIRVVHVRLFTKETAMFEAELRWKNAHRFYRYCSCCVWSRRFWSNRYVVLQAKGKHRLAHRKQIDRGRDGAGPVRPSSLPHRTGETQCRRKAGDRIIDVGKGGIVKLAKSAQARSESRLLPKENACSRSAGLQENERSRWHLLV